MRRSNGAPQNVARLCLLWLPVMTVVPEDDLATASEVSRAQSSCASCDVVKVAFGLAALLSVLLNFAVVRRWMVEELESLVDVSREKNTPGIATR